MSVLIWYDYVIFMRYICMYVYIYHGLRIFPLIFLFYPLIVFQIQWEKGELILNKVEKVNLLINIKIQNSILTNFTKRGKKTLGKYHYWYNTHFILFIYLFWTNEYIYKTVVMVLYCKTLLINHTIKVINNKNKLLLWSCGY